MPAPYAIFCVDPLNPRSVDPAFEAERTAARAAGFTSVQINHDDLDHRVNPQSALRSARFDGTGRAVYRGWMLSDVAYTALFDELKQRHIDLITSPAEYVACHHTPESYAAMAPWTPTTVWVPIPKIDDAQSIRSALSEFGPRPVILKDWVKSQAAGYWAEACFIRDSSDEEEAARVISRFRELQGESLVGGLVFKAYVPLLPVGYPAYEHRAIIVNRKVVGCWPRSQQAVEVGSPPRPLLQRVAEQIPSSFASADFGCDKDGKWWLLEIGDGQVSGLPSDEAAGTVFDALAELVGSLPAA